MKAISNCGDIKAGREYTIMERGLDWYKVKICGKIRYVYSWVFDSDPLKEVFKQL